MREVKPGMATAEMGEQGAESLTVDEAPRTSAVVVCLGLLPRVVVVQELVEDTLI